MSNESLSKDFGMSLVSEFVAYNSEGDKTKMPLNYYVRGSLNVMKKDNGNLCNRNGLKRLGDADATVSPISSEYVWNTSWGATRPVEVTKQTLRVKYQGAYYTLLSGLIKTRYVFDKWYSATEAKDRLLFVKGDYNLQHWSGGITATTNVIGMITSISAAPVSGGTGYTAGDILTIDGGTATITVTSVNETGTPTGVVTNLTLTTGGSGYTTGTKLTTGGTGTGCTVNVATVTALSSNTLTKQDVSTTWAQEGFSTVSGEKKFMIGTTEYTYTAGEDSLTLTGITPALPTMTDGQVVYQSVLTESNTPSSVFKSDFIKVINNQVHVGSYTSRLCYISSSTDFKNYVVPTPRVPGSPELLTLDGTLKGIAVRQGKAHIGYGTNHWAVISFNDITVGTTLTQQTKVDVKPISRLSAPYAHEFIDTVGDTIVYLSQDQQVKTFGDYSNLFTAGFPSVSMELNTELGKQNFTGGAIKCIGEYVYLTAPASGLTYLYQIRQTVDANGNVVAERLWHAPFTWSITRVDEINGTVYGFSSVNPQVYQLWNTNQWHDDSPSDENLPYQSILAFPYNNLNNKDKLKVFDKIYTEGYISPGTELNVSVLYNYLGSKNNITKAMNSVDHPAYLFEGELAPSLGDASLGDEPLGDGETENPDETLPKMKVITPFPIGSVFETQTQYHSDTVDAQWEIIATGSNMKLDSREQPNFIINK